MNSEHTTAIPRGMDPDDTALWEALYDELKVLARQKLRAEFTPDLLQPTALVNEAWLRLSGNKTAIQDRQHFMCMAARVMRHVLIDQARANNRQKRGAGQALVTLSSNIPGDEQAVTADLLDIDMALTRLSDEDERCARTLELHYFGGMNYAEIAAVFGLSDATIKRDLRSGRAWLLAEIASADDG